MEEHALTRPAIDETSFIQKVYAWMAWGLLVTAVIAAITVNTPALLSLVLGNRLVFLALIVVELVLVAYLSFKAQSLSTETASMLFFVYAALNGLTLSAIFLVYAGSSIATAFLTTAGTFGLMSIYGASTKRDLTTVGNIAFMGLLGVLLASLVNMFVGNTGADMIISILGVIVFTALTAYDAQKIKMMRVPAILGALTLYLDFINIFLRILQLGGKRR